MALTLSPNQGRLLPKGIAYNRAFYMGVTGLTLTLTISKATAAFGAIAGAVTEISSGWYKFAADAGDLDTEGDLACHATDGGLNIVDWSDEVAAPVKLADKVAHGGPPNTSTATFAGRSFSIVQTATSGDITDATNASPIVITSAGHGLSSGNLVLIADVEGNTAANGVWSITVADADTFSLNGTAGDGGYTSGGTWELHQTLNAVVFRGASSGAGLTTAGGSLGSGWSSTGVMGNAVSWGVSGAGTYAMSIYGDNGISVQSYAGPTVYLGPTDGNGIDIQPSLSLNAAATAINAVGAGTGKDIDADLFGTTQDFVTTLTESYAADGAAPTPAQAIFQILSFLFERSKSGTTVTCKKLDGTTTSMTFTINDATTPTSQTRAT